MYTVTFVFIFILGTLIGSFLNVVIYRFNTGKSIVKGRSICMSCNKKLRWFELIPIFSWLIQSGKCRRCASYISHQYPLVEFFTGLVFVLLTYKLWPMLYLSYNAFMVYLVFYMFVFSLLIVITVYDIRHKIIPNKLVYIFIFTSLLSLFFTFSSTSIVFTLPSLSSVLSGPILALPFAFIWLISKGKWMGLGDSKLILGIGWLLSPLAAFTALVLSFWIGAIISLIIMFFPSKRYGFKIEKINMKTEIPFAPFLIFGALITFLFNINIISLLSRIHF